MDAYRRAIAHVPRLSDAQIRAFANFVAGDHSWYKKLPLRGAGEPFFVYLHPAPHAAWIETQDGGSAWRAIVREEGEPAWFPRWALDLQPGDIEPRMAPLNYAARGMSTAEYRDRLGHWGYWNYGSPDEPRASALERAAAGLRITTPDGEVGLPKVVVELGLVYLRATVSGDMGPMANEYEKLRNKHDLPSVDDDCRIQLDELQAAMRRVVDWAFEPRAPRST